MTELQQLQRARGLPLSALCVPSRLCVLFLARLVTLSSAQYHSHTFLCRMATAEKNKKLWAFAYQVRFSLVIENLINDLHVNDLNINASAYKKK